MRRGPGGRCAMSRANVVAALPGVLLRIGNFDRLAACRIGLTLLILLQELCEKGAAPSAAGAGPLAETQLRCLPWTFQPNKILHLAARNVEAQTEFGIGIAQTDGLLFNWADRPPKTVTCDQSDSAAC